MVGASGEDPGQREEGLKSNERHGFDGYPDGS
jgi:hypothetical protein